MEENVKTETVRQDQNLPKGGSTDSVADSETRRPVSLWQWECPQCEDVTDGSDPEKFCRFCGEGNIIRNLTSEEIRTDYELMLEDQIA